MKKYGVSRVILLLGALLAGLLLTLFRSTAVDACVAVVLLFVAPGWFITSWRRYSASDWDVYERIYWIVALSVGVVITSGVILNYVGELSRPAWLVWETAIVAVLAAIELLIPSSKARLSVRGDGNREEAPSGIGGGRHRRKKWRSYVPTTSVANVALVVASCCLVVAAIWLSAVSSAKEGRESIVQLSMAPVPVRQGSHALFGDLSLANMTGAKVTVEVRLYVGAQRALAEDWTVRLGEGERWSRTISRRSQNIPLVATLAYEDNPANPIAWVSMGSPVHP